MLAGEMPFRPGTRAARLAGFFVGEAFLGFLAILALALTLLPLWFPLSEAGLATVELVQWLIVAAFAVEFVVAWSAAPSRKAFLTSPWRLVDLATIVVPLLALLPGASNLLRSSPVLRLTRLARVAALGLRVTGVVARRRTGAARLDAPTGPVNVQVVPAETGRHPQGSSWEEFLSWVQSPEPQPKWYNVANLGRGELQSIAAATRLPPALLESHLLSASYPHLEANPNYAVIFAWLVEEPARSPAPRNGLLLLVSPKGLATLTRRDTSLPQLVETIAPDSELAKAGFPIRMTGTILQVILDQNEQLASHFDAELGALEELPVRESRPEFFERTFKLKKELSAAQSDLWRLKGVISELAEKRAQLPGGTGNEAEFFQRLSRDAEFLYDTIINTREGLLSLIELHLNIVSFDMNRVMRVLAVVSVLGLIPAVVGGLFGMNLIDNPWPFTLPQVAFFVVLGMVLCLYLFFIKGWLK
jgi:Mg2+ and Co2+ transporter CorA